MTLWTQVDSNKRKSLFLVFGFVVFVLAVGWLIAYYYNSPGIFVIAIVIAIGQSLIGYYSGDKIVLMTSGAKEIKKTDSPQLWNAVENLTITAGLPMPRVYIIQDGAPNAFATGRDPEHASVAVTTGLLERLNKSELEGVIAHEMSHVGNRDILVMTIVAILVSVIALVSDIFIRAQWFGFGRNRDENNGGGSGLMAVLGLVAIILAPFVGMLVQLAISRKREFLADADGALLTRYPDGLADALEKISSYKAPMRRVSSATSHLFISSPMGAADKDGEKSSGLANLFSTHPPIKERIKILRGMSKG